MRKKQTHFRLKFKFRLFLSVAAVFFVIALLVSFLFTASSFRNARQSETGNSRMVAERISSQVESLYDQMDVAATSITKNPTLGGIVLNLNIPDSSDSQKQFTEELKKTRTIQKTLINLMFSPTISNVLLYNKTYGYFYYTGLYLPDQSFLERALGGDRSYEQMLKDKTDRLYLGPHRSPWTQEDKVVLSVIRSFSDYSTTRSTMVEVQVPYDQLDAICRQDSFGNEKQIVILDSGCSLVYPYDQAVSVLPENTVKTVITQIKSGNLEAYASSYAYYATPILDGRFYVTLLSNQASLKQAQADNWHNAIITVLLILAAACAIIFIIISFISKPLQEMIGYINDISLDQDTSLKLPSDFLDEFELINTSFNQMVEKLKESIKQTYEARLRESNAGLAALQAQINPHFLYNALNSISAASEIYGSEVTTRMCQQFSSMMRYITSSSSQAKLVEEIGHTKNYLDFMKISYDGGFDYGITLQLEMQGLILPRLTIEPIVENSFKHGFKESLPPYRIDIACQLADGHFIIEITDNGCGFSQDALEDFQQFQASYGLKTAPALYLDLNMGGLGLKNIYGRLYSFFDGRIEFTIGCGDGQTGCRITLRGEMNDDKNCGC